MECFFKLVETFHTQAEPAFCGLGTLVNILNALEVDPGTVWKGVWRWYSEEMLDCCLPLAEIESSGTTFDDFICLARCQGLCTEATRAESSSIDAFRAVVLEASRRDDVALAVSYSRRALGQTGDGHFSPIGGYHATSDKVLILDVARFKLPPHWVPLASLWEAMLPKDSVTGKSRGFAIISRPDGWAKGAVAVNGGKGRAKAAIDYFKSGALAATEGCGPGVHAELWAALRALPPLAASLVSMRDVPEDSPPPIYGPRSIRATPIFAALSEAESSPAAGTGPLPVSLLAASALLLLVWRIVGAKALAAALPESAPLVEESAALLENSPDLAAAAAQLRILLEGGGDVCACCSIAGKRSCASRLGGMGPCKHE